MIERRTLLLQLRYRPDRGWRRRTLTTHVLHCVPETNTGRLPANVVMPPEILCRLYLRRLWFFQPRRTNVGQLIV